MAILRFSGNVAKLAANIRPNVPRGHHDDRHVVVDRDENYFLSRNQNLARQWETSRTLG